MDQLPRRRKSKIFFSRIALQKSRKNWQWTIHNPHGHCRKIRSINIFRHKNIKKGEKEKEIRSLQKKKIEMQFSGILQKLMCQESRKSCTSRSMRNGAAFVYVSFLANHTTLQTYRGLRESYANDTEKRGTAYTCVPISHACAYNSRRTADSRGIMQFAHETYGNTRFPCAGTKLQIRVFHSSSSFDDRRPDVVPN